jgi:hypothetical protein
LSEQLALRLLAVLTALQKPLKLQLRQRDGLQGVREPQGVQALQGPQAQGLQAPVS